MSRLVRSRASPSLRPVRDHRRRQGRHGRRLLVVTRVFHRDITWIRPRESWILNRATSPAWGRSDVAGVVMELEAIAECDSIDSSTSGSRNSRWHCASTGPLNRRC